MVYSQGHLTELSILISLIISWLPKTSEVREKAGVFVQLGTSFHLAHLTTAQANDVIYASKGKFLSSDLSSL